MTLSMYLVEMKSSYVCMSLIPVSRIRLHVSQGTIPHFIIHEYVQSTASSVLTNRCLDQVHRIELLYTVLTVVRDFLDYSGNQDLDSPGYLTIAALCRLVS